MQILGVTRPWNQAQFLEVIQWKLMCAHQFFKRGQIGLLLLSALLFPACSSGPLEQTVQQTFQINPTAAITIDNGDGAIRIYGAPSSEMRVLAIKRAYSTERLNKIGVSISARPEIVSIRTIFPAKPKWGFSDRSGTVDYVIVVPETARLTRVHLDTGELLLEGMRSPQIRADLNVGRLFAHNCFSNLQLTVGTGPLALIYDWWEPVKFSVETKIAKGIWFAFLPSNASFHLIAEGSHGEIRNDFTRQQIRSGKSSRIDSVIGTSPVAEIRIRVNRGDIRVAKSFP